MKFLRREEWSECFDEILDEHLGPVLDVSEIDAEDLAEILGEDWAAAIWGCAFEDFLTQDFDVAGVNIVDEYLKRRGWKESAQSKAYMKSLRSSVMSLYEVSDVVPGQSFMARDLIRGGERIAVSERSATKSLKQWDKLAARIVPVMGKNVLAGGLLHFTPTATEILLDSLRRAFGKRNSKKLPVIEDEDLRATASMFSLTWLTDTLDRVLTDPTVENSDGDEIEFHDVRFPFAAGVTQKDVAGRLDAIPALSRENANFWNWLEDEPASQTETRLGEGVRLDTAMDSGLCVLGYLELKDRSLHLSTNSSARAAKGTAIVREALGDLVRTPLTEIRTVAQMMAERPIGNPQPKTPAIPPEIEEDVVHQFLDRHYRETLDEPVEMLGNKTPRQAVKTPSGRRQVADWLKYLENQNARRPDPCQAVKTPSGRRQVADWLKYLENQNARRPDPSDPMATYSFEWMWEELGIQDLRQ
ncbi:hypothetical protein MesoLjLc_46880 [Mesorhizobium sp. L-8-10]|nr:hypothetical protein MesoLjLc_46880 [Mesorhizobium sp. L-8-10]